MPFDGTWSTVTANGSPLGSITLIVPNAVPMVWPVDTTWAIGTAFVPITMNRW